MKPNRVGISGDDFAKAKHTFPGRTVEVPETAPPVEVPQTAPPVEVPQTAPPEAIALSLRSPPCPPCPGKLRVERRPSTSRQERISFVPLRHRNARARTAACRFCSTKVLSTLRKVPASCRVTSRGDGTAHCRTAAARRRYPSLPLHLQDLWPCTGGHGTFLRALRRERPGASTTGPPARTSESARPAVARLHPMAGAPRFAAIASLDCLPPRALRLQPSPLRRGRTCTR